MVIVHQRLFAILAASVVLLLAGCSTVNSRIKANAALFDSLPIETQEGIRKGIVRVGYTPDMVYIALGEPHERSRTRSASRDRESWIYNTYYRDWVGRVHVGYRRIIMEDPGTKKKIVYVEPVYEDVYRDRKEEQIRIVFVDGAVSLIEERRK